MSGNLGLANGGAWPQSLGGRAAARIRPGGRQIKTFISPRDPSDPPPVDYVEGNGGTWGISNYGANHAIFGIPCTSNFPQQSRLTLTGITTERRTPWASRSNTASAAGDGATGLLP